MLLVKQDHHLDVGHPFHFQKFDFYNYDIVLNMECFRFFLKVKDHSFKYQLNLKEGIVSNKPLFDRTVGLGRTF